MISRYRGLLVAFALLALAVLMFRPIVLDAMGMPYGTQESVKVELVKADGSPHCVLLADCETISISGLGLHFSLTALLPLVVGVALLAGMTRSRVLHSWAVLVPNPPPLPSLR